MRVWYFLNSDNSQCCNFCIHYTFSHHISMRMMCELCAMAKSCVRTFSGRSTISLGIITVEAYGHTIRGKKVMQGVQGSMKNSIRASILYSRLDNFSRRFVVPVSFRNSLSRSSPITLRIQHFNSACVACVHV